MDCATLPEGLPDRVVDVVLSCYTLAYLDPEDAHVAMLGINRMAEKALILVEPMRVTHDQIWGQCRDDGLPEWRHDYERTLGALGWHTSWKWPLVPPVQHTNTVLVMQR